MKKTERFQRLYFADFHVFHVKKLKIIYMIFNLYTEENLVLNNKTIECLCLATIVLIVAHWKFNVI